MVLILFSLLPWIHLYCSPNFFFSFQFDLMSLVTSSSFTILLNLQIISRGMALPILETIVRHYEMMTILIVII